MVRFLSFFGWLGLCASAIVSCSSAGGAGAEVRAHGGESSQAGADTVEDGEGGENSEGLGGEGGGEGEGEAGMSGAGEGGQPSGGSGGDPFEEGGSGGISLGGNGSGGDSACAAVAQKAETKMLPADIIWVVDTSGSMDAEMASVQQKMNGFAQGILSVGIDVRVVLLADEFHCPDPFWNCSFMPFTGMCLPAPLGSGACPKDANPPIYTHPNIVIGSSNGLTQILASYPQWKGALRKESVKFIVAVTDDDATFGPYNPSKFLDKEQGSAAKFIQDFTALDPSMLTGFKMSGIYCFSKCPEAANQGKVWDAIVDQTGGVKGDLCKQDFQPIFNDLAKGVQAAAKLDCSWKIPSPPSGQVFDPGMVNVKYTSGSGTEEDILFAGGQDKCDPTEGGWYYDDNSNPTTVNACPSTCAHIQKDLQGKIDVLFGCATRPIIN